MAKNLSKIKLYIGQAVNPAVSGGTAEAADIFDAIGNIVNGNGPNFVKPQVDSTDQDSSQVEQIGGLPDAGEFTATVNINDNETTGAMIAGHDRCEADAAVPGQARWFRLDVIRPSDNVVLRRYSWIGEVLSWSPTYQAGAVKTAQISVRVNQSRPRVLRP